MPVSTFVRRLPGLALVAVLLLATRSQAQTVPAWTSVQRATPAQSSASRHSVGKSIAVAADGSQYIAGRFAGSLTLGAVTLTAANGLVQLYLAKYDASGVALWATQVTSATGIVDGKVAVDAGGNVYLAGSFYTDITLGTVVLTSPGQGAFLVKYNAQGVRQWVQQGGPYASADGLVIDASGNITVVGACAPGMSFGGTALNGGGIYRYVFSPAGTVQQATRIGSTSSGYASINDVALDGAGNSYLVGSVSGTMVLGNTTLTSTAGSEDVFLCKFDAAGTLAWAWTDGGTSGYKANDLAVDAAGNPLIGGYAFDVNAPTAPSKVYIARFTTQGTQLWSRLIVPVGSIPSLNRYQNAVYGVAYDGRGGCLATGVFAGTLAFGTTTLTNPLIADQLFVVRYDGQGTAEWAGQTVATGPVPGDGFAVGMGMTVDAGGNAYICGTVGGSELFGTLVSGAAIGSGYYDTFVAKLTPGRILATRPATALALAAYPNPATGLTTLQLPMGGGQLEVLDALGRRVRQQALPATAGPCAVPLHGLAPGLYQLRAVLGNGQPGHAMLQVE